MNPMNDTPGSSATRQGLAGLIGYALTTLAASHGLPIPAEYTGYVAAAIAGGIGYAWRRWVMPLAG